MNYMLVAEIELWIIRLLLIYGLVVGVWFLATWGPHVPKGKRFDLATMDVGGWVAAFVVIYAILVLVLPLSRPPGCSNGEHSGYGLVLFRSSLILFTLVVDIAMTVRHLHWRRIQIRESA